MSERNDTSRCPEPEVVAAFIEGTLTGESLRAMTEHLATCDECLAVMTPHPNPLPASGERSNLASVSPLPARGKRVRVTGWLALAASLMMVAALGVIVARSRNEQGSMRALIAAAPSYRTVEPRLGGFAWAELRRLRADESAPSDPEALRLAGAAGEVLARADGQPHAAGVAELLLAKPARAIERLRDAVAREPQNATAWSDLAAAYYASAVQARRADALPDALASADRALAIDASHAEARFNRALILERMALRAEAAEAWRAYLAIDAKSPWADEARRHLQALVEKPQAFEPRALENRAALESAVRAQTEPARKWAETEILGQWGESMLASRLVLARAIGESLVRINGDALLADTVQAIDRDPRALAEAHALYRRGRLRYRERDLTRASAELNRAADAFARAGSPMNGVARLYAASVAFDENRTDDAASQFEDLVRATPAKYASLAAEARHQLGRCAMREGRWSEAAAELDVAASLFGRLHESWSLGLVEAALGDARAALGDRTRAWEHRVAAFDALSRGPAGQRLLATIASAAWSELRDERLESAAALLRLEISEARRLGNRLLIADAYRRSALLHARAGDEAAGARDLREARAQLAREGDSGLRARVDAACILAEGVLARRSDTRRSAALLTRAIEFLRGAGERSNLAEALAERAITRRDEGATDAAREDFLAALRERDPGADPRFVDEAIALLLARGEAADAFAYAERARGSDATVESVQRALPAHAMLVEYTGVAAFCITPTDFRHVAINVNRAEFAEEVRRVRETIARRGDSSAMLAKLHAQLIAPLPRDATSLIIVADPVLRTVPWAALRDREYLIERCAIATAPSAGLWLRAQSQAARNGARLLLVADDTRTELDALERLRHEADAVAALYVEPRVLLHATPDAFAREANDADVIHFAGHARGGAESALLMAGELRARDIRRLHLTRPRLAVLAGCSTGDELARAFFDAGVPGVIGTLWAVDDAQAATLFEDFHRRLRAGATAADALRDAQLAMLRSGGSAAHPASWAVAELLGS